MKFNHNDRTVFSQWSQGLAFLKAIGTADFLRS